ncbi:Sedlin, N-terminal conserved region-domain-containing protein [Scheffersomyces amazonensis]|uniref:Sedlin, N-terminal conserved region-domain-containing protein n=1 Tax=Scheffersomyces amazonensis TaxID=1078765 RepID=UPI00315C4C43
MTDAVSASSSQLQQQPPSLTATPQPNADQQPQPDTVLSSPSTPTAKPPNNQSLRFISIISRHDKPLYIQSFNSLPNSSPKDEEENNNNFLKYNFLSHMALDIFSSPSSLNLREQQYYTYQRHVHSASASGSNSASSNTSTTAASTSDLGVILLFIQDGIEVYGYETNNGLKLIIGLSNNSSSNTPPPHKVNYQDIKSLFQSVYKCYIRLICNPFNYSLATSSSSSADSDQTIDNVTFDNNIAKIVKSWI